jgi:hypothetical protein
LGLFKYLIASLLSFSLNDDGWVSVPKVVKPQEQGGERDPSIWILFAKNLGDEQIMVRFPDEPEYRYDEAGRLQVVSEARGESFSLTLQKIEKKAPEVVDLHYFEEGKWVHEHIVQNERYQALFKTISDLENSPNHKEFVNSFEFFS